MRATSSLLGIFLEQQPLVRLQRALPHTVWSLLNKSSDGTGPIDARSAYGSISRKSPSWGPMRPASSTDFDISWDNNQGSRECGG